MRDERPYLRSLIDTVGGLPAAAQKWQIPYSTLASFANGHRGITPRMASRIALAEPMADATRLVWVRPIRRAEPSPDAQASEVPRAA